MVDIIHDPDYPRAVRYRELEKTDVVKGGESVQRVLTAVRNFTNHFIFVDKNMLYSLAIGAAVPMEVVMDVFRAEALG